MAAPRSALTAAMSQRRAPWGAIPLCERGALRRFILAVMILSGIVLVITGGRSLRDEVHLMGDTTLKELVDMANRRAQAAEERAASLETQLAQTRTGLGSTSSDPLALKEDRIAVLVIACSRPTVKRALDLIFKYRPANGFPVILSQDCGDVMTARIIEDYEHELIHLQQPNLSDIKLPPNEKHFENYYKISRHYKWALTQVFDILQFEQVIIIEDDLDIAPDFFEYFRATLPLLRADPTLYCVSAWNDNGKTQLVHDPALLYRTDFFPGLGWMLTRSLWDELKPKWPGAFWDDWLRDSAQRLGRACIRPEVSRTFSFGREGASGGQYFDQHLKFIKLNAEPIEFTKQNLKYLLKEEYDPVFLAAVYSAPLTTLTDLLNDRVSNEASPAVRIEYASESQFAQLADRLELMPDFRAGIARASYYGVVPFRHNGQMVYLAPPKAA